MQTQQPATASADAGTVSLDYQTCRNRREAAEAELAELELAERQGQLIRVDGVTALINRSKNLVLTQAQLNRPEGVRFAQGAINAYRSILGDIAGCHEGSFVMGVDIEPAGIVTKGYVL
jgi:multidrug efflux pump subunit AcrA (membrane-fusion protein)